MRGRRQRSKYPTRLFTFAELYERIVHLVEAGQKVTNHRARGSEINDWLRKVKRVLALPALELTHIFERFEKLKVRYKVSDDEVEESSCAAYRHVESDQVFDFDFDSLEQAARMLDIARETIELKLSEARTRGSRSAKKPHKPTAVVSDPPPTDAKISPGPPANHARHFSICTAAHRCNPWRTRLEEVAKLLESENVLGPRQNSMAPNIPGSPPTKWSSVLHDRARMKKCIETSIRFCRKKLPNFRQLFPTFSHQIGPERPKR
jgi:hypothetical protein